MKIHIFALRWRDEIRRSSQLKNTTVTSSCKLGLTEGIFIENQEGLAMHQVKVKFFDRNITFPSNSRLF